MGPEDRHVPSVFETTPVTVPAKMPELGIWPPVQAARAIGPTRTRMTQRIE